MKKICYGSFFLLTLLVPLSLVCAEGGALYVLPDNGVYQIGKSFEVKVLANTDGHVVNAIEAELAYNPSDFAIEDISIAHSILTSWSTVPAYNGAQGIIRFSGWAEKSYSGKAGQLITITLRPLRVTQSTLLFNSGAMLSADGHGSNIITTMSSGSYATSPKQVEPPPPPPVIVPVSTQDESVVVPQNQGEVSSGVISPPVVTRPDQAAAAILSGAELGPMIVVAIAFFALLTTFAFCIAYILHRKKVR